MDALAGFILFILFIALIVGVISPKHVLVWDKSPSRFKVILYWFFSTFVITIALAAVIDEDEIAADKIARAIDKIEKGDLKSARTELVYEKYNGDFKVKMDSLISVIDSMIVVENRRIADSTEVAAKHSAVFENQKEIELLNREINSIDSGINFNTYRGNITSIQLEIVMFSFWGDAIDKGLVSTDSVRRSLAMNLKEKVERIQEQEFPILRLEYSKIIAKTVWENDVEISVSGYGNEYLNITGAIFAANKNKKAFQDEIHEMLTYLRFEQSRYRWYSGQDEYTYWTIYEGSDSDRVIVAK